MREFRRSVFDSPLLHVYSFKFGNINQVEIICIFILFQRLFYNHFVGEYLSYGHVKLGNIWEFIKIVFSMPGKDIEM